MKGQKIKNNNLKSSAFSFWQTNTFRSFFSFLVVLLLIGAANLLWSKEAYAATATYDFSLCSTTCDTSADWWLSDDDVDVFPFASVPDNRNDHDEATDTQYDNVSSSNDVRWTTTDPGASDEIFIWNEMKITEPVGSITNIDLTFEGYPNNNTTSNFTIYVLKGTDWAASASWVAVGTAESITGPTEETVTRSITSAFSDYIGSDGMLIWGVAESISSESVLIDYLKATITYSTVTVSGTCQNYARSADCTNDGSNEIRVAVDGVLRTEAASIDTTVDGSWSLTAPKAASGSVYTVFVNTPGANSKRAAATTTYSGSGNIGSIALYEEHLSIGSDQNTSVTNVNLNTYDYDNDTDIPYQVTSGNALTIDNAATSSQEKLYVASGDTFAPYGDVTTHDMDIVGTFTANGGTYTVSGSWSDTGTFNPIGNTTVLFNAGNTGETITTTGSSFNNVTFNNASGGWTLQDDASVNGILTITAGNFDASSRTVTFTGAGNWCNDTSGVTCDTNWLYRKKITLNNSASTENLLNFPIAVQLTSSDIDFAKTKDNGYDLRFVDPADNTTVLDHEIEKWDETGTQVVWVRIPRIDAGSTTDYVWLYYGNSNASNGENVTGVWDSNYVMVHHFEESPNNSVDQVQDSTSSNNDGTTISMAGDSKVASKVGYGYDFDGTADRMYVGDVTSIRVQKNTMSAWVKHDATIASGDRLFIIDKVWSGALDAYGISFQGFGTNTAYFRHLHEPNAEDSWYDSSSPTSAVNDTWYNFAANWDGKLMNSYVNGSLQTNLVQGDGSGNKNHTAALTYSTQDLQIGSEDQSGCCQSFWDGIIDEVRISNISRSAEWIEAEYLFSVDTTKFSYGTEETITTTPFVRNGTFTYSTSTLKFQNPTAAIPPAMSGAAGTNGYYNLEASPAAIVTYTLATGTYKVNNNLTVGNASNALTLQVNTNDPVLDVDGAVTINVSAIFEASGSSALTVGGSFTNGGTFNHNSYTITFDGTGTAKTINNGSSSFYNVIFDGSGSEWSPLTNTLTVANDFTMTNGTLNNDDGNASITVNGNVACGASCGTITLTQGTFTQSVDTNKNFGTSVAVGTNWSFNNLTFTATSDTITTSSTGTGTITAAGVLTISSSTTLDAGNRTWVLSGNSTPFSISGIFTPNTSTFQYSHGTSATVTATTFYNLSFTGAGTYTLPNSAWGVNKNFTNGASSILTKGTGTLTFGGTAASTFTDNNSTKQNVGIVSINKTDTGDPSTNDKLTLASGMKVDTMTVDGTAGQADTLDLGSSGYTLEIANAGATATVFTMSGTFTAGTSTVNFSATNSGGNITVPRLTYSSLSVTGAETYEPAGGGTLTVGSTLTIGNSSNATIFNVDTNDPVLDVNGNVSITASATLTASASAAFTVAGNFTDAGTFNHSNGSITFDTTGVSEIDGNSTIFYNFSATTSTKIVKFKQGETVRINGLLTLTNVTLDSINGSTQWTIYHSDSPVATENIDGTTIYRSACHASSTEIDAFTSDGNVDGGSNGTCWKFSSVITVAGTVYLNDESTADGTGYTIKASVNGGTATSSSSNGSGVFSFATGSAPAVGQFITIWIDSNGGNRGTIVLKYGASCAGYTNCTGLKIVRDQVRLENFNTGNIINTDLAACDNDTGTGCTDTDIGFTANSGVLTVSSSWELKVSSGVTLAPGGDVSTPKLDVAGTYTGASEVLTLSGAGTSTTCTNSAAEPLCVSGTYTPTNNITRFTSTSATNIPARTYYDLEFKPAGIVTHTLDSGTVTVNHNLIIGNASNAVTLQVNTNDPILDVNGTVTIAASAILQASTTAAFTVASDFTNDGAFTANSGTLTFDGISGSVNLGSVGFDCPNSPFDVVFNNASGSWTNSQPMCVDNSLTVTTGTLSGGGNYYIGTTGMGGAGTLNSTGQVTLSGPASALTNVGNWTVDDLFFGDDGSGTHTFSGAGSLTVTDLMIVNPSHIFEAGSKTYILSGTGTPFTVDGTFTAQNSTFRFTGNGATTLARTTYNNLESKPAGAATHTFAGGGALVIGGTLTIGTGSDASILNASTNDPILDINDSVIINASATFQASDAQDMTVAKSWTNSGTFTNNGRTVTFDGSTGGQTITANNSSGIFNNLTISGAGAWTVSTNAMQVSGDLIVDSGTLQGAQNVTVSGGDLSGTGIINMSGGTFTLTGTPLSNFGGSNGWTFDSLTIGGATNTTYTATGSGSITVNETLTIDTSDTLNAGSKTWILTDADGCPCTPLVATGSFTAGTSTFRYTGAATTSIAGTANGGGIAYYNLQVFPGGASVTHTLGTASSQTIVINGDLDVGGNSNATSTVVTAATHNPAITVVGDLTICATVCSNDVTFTKGNGTLTLSPVSTESLTDNNTSKQDLGIISITGGTSTPKIQFDTNIKATTIAIAASHELNIQTLTLTLSGNGATVLDKNASGTFTAGTDSTVDFSSTATTGTTVPSLTYYNLTVNRASNTFTASSGSLVVGNNLNITAGTLTLVGNDPTTTVGGTLTIDGTLTASDLNSITVNGDFTNNGTFTSNGGTLAIGGADGTTSTIGGSQSTTTFGTFLSSVAGKLIAFKAGNTFVFSTALNLTGVSGNHIRLKSDSIGQQWLMTLSGSNAINYVSVRDSGCSGGNTVGASDIIHNYGNNGVCWSFVFLKGGGTELEASAAPAGLVSGGSGGGSGGSGGSTTATGDAVMSGNVVASVTITFGGSGYSTPPSVSFCGGGGSGAAGTAVLTGDAVTSVNITNGGSGYSSAPSVLFGGTCGGGGGGGGGGDSGFFYGNGSHFAVIGVSGMGVLNLLKYLLIFWA